MSKKTTDSQRIEELNYELEMIEYRKIPLEQMSDEILNNCSYESLSSLRDELKLLLCLLDLRRYCDYIRSIKVLNDERKQYRKEIKRIYRKVILLQEIKKSELPDIVKAFLNEFNGTIEYNFSSSYSMIV